MNCKYCGAGLPTKGGVCPSCGKMIPISQQKQMREMLDPNWNMYHNKDTAMYKSQSNTDSETKIGAAVCLIVVVIVVILIIAIVKGMG